ncbi:exopolysaccharide biosynthesis GT2 family glycosyltransferase EpsU [Hyalangium sp.]|uniref:exopolysaccharide biosynthesis GT2 family glycosyltransferase EpsU n=1 Tax=Hyalangium sp. TaxID=2028555 RepID=UPI002D4D003D|nr:exopolysaccharide biosynthesis GT2 family glycosyltransferase EpsU [Hyalangium sp.]HYH98381.1 exopolysaccharide biosynthesis GT2 family glycosyltransferase EpsU [Hyalangium sp.]
MWADGLVLVLALPVVVACGYLLLLTLLSAGRPAPPRVAPRLKFDIIVPAHNEEAGIAGTVANLSALDYPAALRRILVVADNCSDATADRAREAGATVLVRHDTEKRGKGFALAHAFEYSLRDGFAAAVVVVDADTEVSPHLLHSFGLRLEAGAHAVQAHYGVLNPHTSWRTRLMTIALALFHKVRSMGRERLNVSCGLRGNGMCFSHRVIREVPHDAFSIVEDLEYGIRLGRAGHRVHYAWEAEVLGEMVSSEKAARSQRRRWEGGRWAMTKQFGVPLLGEALRKRDGVLLDLAMDLLVPPLSYVVLGAFALTVAAGALSVWQGPALLSASAASFCVASLGLYVLRGWWVSGMGARGLLDLMRAPFYVFWKVWLMVAGPRDKKGEWVRTTREARKP